MNTFFRKFFGTSLIVVAILGMILSSFGAVSIWTVRPSLLASLDETTELLLTTLDTTTAGLSIVDDSLNTATGTIAATTQTAETLAQSLVEINSLANGIIGLLNLVGGDIETPEKQTNDLSAEVQSMTSNLNQVTNSLSEAQEVVDVYQEAVSNAKSQLENIQKNGPNWITIIAVFLTIILIWLAVAQVGLLLYGVEFIRRK